MKLEMTYNEICLLHDQLSKHIALLDGELVRTDKADLQHGLARDIDVLRSIDFRVERLIAEHDRASTRA